MKYHDPDSGLMLKLFMGFVALVLLVTFATSALAADYVCDPKTPIPGECTAMISEGGKLLTVSFRKGDTICTEDGWIIERTYDPTNPVNSWRRPKGTVGSSRPTTYSMGGGPVARGSLAQARGPFRFYRGLGTTQRWDGSVVTWTSPVTVASGYYEPLSGTWREVPTAKVKEAQ